MFKKHERQTCRSRNEKVRFDETECNPAITHMHARTHASMHVCTHIHTHTHRKILLFLSILFLSIPVRAENYHFATCGLESQQKCSLLERFLKQNQTQTDTFTCTHLFTHTHTQLLFIPISCGRVIEKMPEWIERKPKS